jgi:small-conductance mechanosensitive channel
MESLKDRTGESVREQVERLTSVTESLRDKTANTIERLEKSLRPRPERKRTRKKVLKEKPPEEEPAVSKTPDEKRE